MNRFHRVAGLVGVLLIWSGGPAHAKDDGGSDQPTVSADPFAPDLHVQGELSTPATSSDPGGSSESNASSPSPISVRYSWKPACSNRFTGSDVAFCAGAQSCPNPGEILWTLWALPTGETTWQPLGSECHAQAPPIPTGAAAPRPQVTPGLVLRAVRSMGLPSATIRIQPARTTLVNFDTIFYAAEPSFDRSITLLGYDVDIVANPATYRWHAGDGASFSTATPGGPFPSKEVVHRYTAAHRTVRPSVDVTYQVRFRIDGGAWQTLDQTLTAAGPSTALAIREAAPVLVS